MADTPRKPMTAYAVYARVFLGFVTGTEDDALNMGEARLKENDLRILHAMGAEVTADALLSDTAEDTDER